MLLAVDIGNTQTSFGVYDAGGSLQYHWRAETHTARTADEYASALFPLLDHAGLKGKKWDGVAVASVVPAADFSFHLFCRDYLGVEAFSIHSGVSIGCSLQVDNPREVGADRLANAAYAVHHLELPAVVVDIGTATTFDVITAGKVYEGGIILPGVRVAVESLGRNTAKLPVIDLKFPARVIGRNTIDCIRSGVLHGYCDLIDGLLGRVERELGGAPEVALTGGLAFLFENKLTHRVRLLPNLTLDGIALIHQLNLRS